MIKFLRNLLASLTALVLFCGFWFTLFMFFSIALQGENETVVKDNTILTINLNKPIKDYAFEDPFMESFFNVPSSNYGLVQIQSALEKAKTDDKIKGILIKATTVNAGYATVNQLRDLLLDFKTSGKFIYAHSTIYTEKAYYLASVADKVFVTPEGMVEFNGISANLTFFKGTLEKLKIEPQVFKVGNYKSAVEPFIKDKMSPENREQMEYLFNDIQLELNKNVAKSRNKSLEYIGELISQGKIATSKDAYTHGIIDSLLYDDEFRSFVQTSHFASTEKIRYLDLGKYKGTGSFNSSKEKVAVLVANGEINYSEETSPNQEYIGQTYFLNQLRKIKKDDNIKALVLRINSPGGSFLTSDVLWKEIAEVKKLKPVIASMNDYAASGGYYMAMGADTIMAEPTTITGSIGIFSIVFNVENMLKEHMGISHDVVKTGEMADVYTMTRPLNEKERAFYQEGANHGYEIFTTKAARGRNMPIEDLKAVASGRVWTGNQAIENGLVDLKGNLFDAIALAKEMSGLPENAKVRYYPKYLSFLERFSSSKVNDQNTTILEKELADLYPIYKQLKSVQSLKGRQARLPFLIEID